MNEPDYYTYRCYQSNFDLNKAQYALDSFRKKYKAKNSEIMIMLDTNTFDALVVEEQHIPTKMDGVSILTSIGVSRPIVFFKSPSREFKRIRVEREKLNYENRKTGNQITDIDSELTS